MSYYVEELPAFWEMRRHFKTKFKLAYRRYNLPEFVYWYCQWIIADENNPHCNMFWLDYLKNIRFYQIVMNRARAADKSGLDSRPFLSDIIRETCPIAGFFIGSEPDHRKWKYRRFSATDIISLVEQAAEVAAFKEKYLKVPAETQLAGQPSPCKEIADACRTDNPLKYAWWWSVWTATKDRRHLDNRYWDDFDRMSARDLLHRLKDYQDLFNTKDSDGQYIFDVFRNPFSDTGHFGTASLPIVRAIQCLEPFVNYKKMGTVPK